MSFTSARHSATKPFSCPSGTLDALSAVHLCSQRCACLRAMIDGARDVARGEVAGTPCAEAIPTTSAAAIDVVTRSRIEGTHIKGEVKRGLEARQNGLNNTSYSAEPHPTRPRRPSGLSSRAVRRTILTHPRPITTARGRAAKLALSVRHE